MEVRQVTVTARERRLSTVTVEIPARRVTLGDLRAFIDATADWPADTDVAHLQGEAGGGWHEFRVDREVAAS